MQTLQQALREYFLVIAQARAYCVVENLSPYIPTQGLIVEN